MIEGKNDDIGSFSSSSHAQPSPPPTGHYGLSSDDVVFSAVQPFQIRNTAGWRGGALIPVSMVILRLR